MILNGTYKFTGSSVNIVYIGKSGAWHQFTKDGELWAELLTVDLELLEKVKVH